jgi:hypothetical protein
MIDLAYTEQALLGRFDLVLTNGALDPMLSSGTDEIDQRLVRTLRLFRGELLFDETLGVPWYQQILAIKGIDLSVVEQALRAEILRQPDVLGFKSFSVALDMTARTLTISFVAQTTDGSVTVEEVLPL